MRVLITGIAGHLGSRFAKWILKHQTGVEVWGVDNLSCGYSANVPKEVKRWIQADLTQLEAMDNDVDFDYIFHFAAYAAECLSPFIRQYNYANNLLSTAALINWAIEKGTVKRFVYASSMAVYGEGMYPPPFQEEDRLIPADPYGIAKMACEMDLRVAGQQHGLDYCIIRPHNLYGPGQSIWQKYRNVLGLWMRAALEGKPLLVYGDGRQQRAFSYLEDCLPCFWASAVAPTCSRETINLGGQQPIAIKEAAALVSKLTGGTEIVYREPRHEVKNAWCTVDKSKKLLGYAEHTPLELGLVEMWDWAREAWERYPERRVEPGIELEITKGLYEYWC